MSTHMTHRLKQIHAEMAVLRSKKAGKGKLSKEDQTQLDQLMSERDGLLTDALFHTY